MWSSLPPRPALVRIGRAARARQLVAVCVLAGGVACHPSAIGNNAIPLRDLIAAGGAFAAGMGLVSVIIAPFLRLRLRALTASSPRERVTELAEAWRAHPEELDGCVLGAIQRKRYEVKEETRVQFSEELAARGAQSSELRSIGRTVEAMAPIPAAVKEMTEAVAALVSDVRLLGEQIKTTTQATAENAKAITDTREKLVEVRASVGALRAGRRATDP